ncbi:hypothetical protein CCYA_CCYA15G3992 [Cyanidiococcus yangmingshanensis]|nr:hypothetical protein CCYA_CCYA15G3992 [Cyanidiococcus yangmingshanensis]
MKPRSVGTSSLHLSEAPAVTTPASVNVTEGALTDDRERTNVEDERLQLPALAEGTETSLDSLPLLVQLSDSHSSGGHGDPQPNAGYALVHVSPVATIAEVKQELARQGYVSAEELPSVQLSFGEEALEEDSPLAQYLLPELYDHSEALLRMVDQGGLDLERKQEAMERALQVIETLRSGVPSGRLSTSTAGASGYPGARLAGEPLNLPGIDVLPRPRDPPRAVHSGVAGGTPTTAGAVAAPLWMPTVSALSPTSVGGITSDMSVPWSPLQAWSPRDVAERLHQMEPKLFTPQGVSAVGALVPSSGSWRRQSVGDSVQPHAGASGTHTSTSSDGGGGPLPSVWAMPGPTPSGCPQESRSTVRATAPPIAPEESTLLRAGAVPSPVGAGAGSCTSDLTGQSHWIKSRGASHEADESVEAATERAPGSAPEFDEPNERLLENLESLPERWILSNTSTDRKRSRAGNESVQGTEASSGESRRTRVVGLSAEERRLRRMEQNRRSAERSRLRKKELEERYRMAVRQLTEENAELRRQLETFREQVQRMQQLLALQMRPNSMPMDLQSPQG